MFGHSSQFSTLERLIVARNAMGRFRLLKVQPQQSELLEGSTLRGQLVGLAELPRHLAARPAVQRGRRVSDQAILAVLSPVL